MINNRQGGRRRGRGGQRPQGMPGGGGNRQDNRQRGNATQLLEKYKSMARDAQLAGDRVQTEYYLQFAEHYFRVLGESRVRFDEQKRGRDDRDDDGDGDEDGESDLVEADADSEPEAEEQQSRRPSRSRDRDEPPARAPRRGNSDGHGEQEKSGGDERIAFEALPPSIGGDAEDAQDAADDGEEAPRPRRRARKPRAEDGEADIAPAA